MTKTTCSLFTADCSLFKKTHCHSIVIHSHTIVSICNAVRKQLCDHCINYCVTIVIIVHCLQVFPQSCFPNPFNLVFPISSTLTSNIINLFFTIFSIFFIIISFPSIVARLFDNRNFFYCSLIIYINFQQINTIIKFTYVNFVKIGICIKCFDFYFSACQIV